jgi:hypothetical protein
LKGLLNILAEGVAELPPKPILRVAEPPPWLLGVIRPPPRAKKKKQKEKREILGFALEGSWTNSKGHGGCSATPRPADLGWPSHPYIFFIFYFFSFFFVYIYIIL